MIPCDTCGKKADAIHFVSKTRPYPRQGDVQVRFTCPRHDDGDYWLTLEEWLKPSTNWMWNSPEHIARKKWGPDALDALMARSTESPAHKKLAERTVDLLERQAA